MATKIRSKLFCVLMVAVLLALYTLSVGAASDETVIYFFKMKGCSHCTEEKPFLEELRAKYPSLVVVDKEIRGNQENLELMKKMGEEYGREVRSVPATFIGDDVWVGFTEKIASKEDKKRNERQIGDKRKRETPEPKIK